jgi:hypothetical protein
VTVDDGARLGTRGRSVAVVIAAVITCYAAVASTTKSNTAPAVMAVALPVATVGLLAFRRPYPVVDESRRLRRTTEVWAAVAITGFLWEAGAYLGEHTVGQYQFPTLSVLSEPALADPMVRFGAWLLWLLAGWRLVRR